MIKKLRLFSTLLLLAVVSAAWGEEVTASFDVSSYANSNNWTNQQQYLTANVGDVTFAVSGESTLNNSGKYYNSDNSWRFYANEGAKLTISVPDGNTLVSVTPTFTTKDNGTVLFGTNTCASGIAVNVSGTSVEFTISQSSGNKGKVFFTAIAVTYTTSGGNTAVATTTTIDDSGINNTDVHLGTAAGSLTASVTTGGTSVPGATVTWSGNNNDVATIDESTGEVTLVSAGTVIFTARYAGVSGTYQSSSDTYEMTVTDSTPFSGGDVTFNAGTDVGTTTGNNSPDQVTKNRVTISATDAAFATAEYRFYKNSETTISTEQGVITQIAFIATSNYPASGFAAQDGWTTEGNNGTWTGSAQSVSFTASGAQVRATKIVVTVDLNAAPVPVINASDVNITYDATDGNIGYTIDNPNEGTSLTAVVKDGNWLTLGTVTENSVPFACSANEAAEPRTATVTLTYGDVTKDVTVTQAAAPVSYTTIPALFEAATSETKDVNVTFNNWVVSGVSTNGKNVYVTDGTNGFVIFDNAGGLNETYSVGSVLSGTAVPCKLVLYNGFAELTNIEVDKLTIAGGGNVTVANIALANLDGVNTGAVVSYEGLTCSVNSGKYYLTDGTNTLQVYNSLYTFETLEDGAKYNITGVYQQYNKTKEILPRSADDIVKVEEPSITVASTEIEVVAAGAEGTINVTYNNITNVEAEVQFVGADGTSAATYDWIEAEVNDENNISYIVNENTSTEARIAYLKVYALDDNANDVYSDLISITQKGITIDYATLPFTYDGNGQGELPTGLTQSGVGSYTTSPSMKFDSEGDYLILKMNEAPKALYFDVKGNPGQNGWAGTFNVQTSVDGETYTDLASYTELTNDVQKVILVNIPATVRYIKWIYTEKKSGNVALGNIIASNDITFDEKANNAYDFAAVYDANVGENKNVKMLREFGSDYWNTLVVPFDLTRAQLEEAFGEGVQVAKYTDFNKPANIKFEKTTGDVTRADLMIVKPAATVTNPIFKGVTLEKGKAYNYPSVEKNYSDTKFAINGRFAKQVLTDDDVLGKVYFLNKQGKFTHPTADGNVIRGFRWFIQLKTPESSTGAKITLDVDGDVTSIDAIDNGQFATDAIYNLSGQRVNKAQKGIYIVNGKKVVVK